MERVKSFFKSNIVDYEVTYDEMLDSLWIIISKKSERVGHLLVQNATAPEIDITIYKQKWYFSLESMSELEAVTKKIANDLDVIFSSKVVIKKERSFLKTVTKKLIKPSGELSILGRKKIIVE